MTSKVERLREIEEEIMETLFDLSIDKGGSVRIRMGEILDRIGPNVAKTQLTNIVRRKLEPRGYVDYLPYEGIVLTKEGFQVARKIARNHRLAEAMLYQIFNIPWMYIHEEACAIEHGITDRMADYIYKKLKVKITPFGMPIPHGEIEDLGCDDICLLDISSGTSVTLTRVISHSTDTAKELIDCGIPERPIGVDMVVKNVDKKGVLVEMNKNDFFVPAHLSKTLCVKIEKD